MKKQIAILGSTGSIGTQALQVIENHSDLYEAYVLTANNNVELLIEQARKFHPEVVIIANKNKYPQLKEALNDLPVKIYAGMDAICQVVESSPIDIVNDITTPSHILDDGWLKYVLAVIALIIVLIILAPLLPYVFKFLLWLLMLPAKLVVWVINLFKKKNE